VFVEKKKYINLTLSVPEELYDLVYGVLIDFQTVGIEEKFDELIVSFSNENWNDEAENELMNQLMSLNSQIRITKKEIIEEKNWNEVFEKNSPLVIVNERIGIAPEWKQNELNTKIKILINPKMSFGTGDHATTRLMCRLMENSVKPNSAWIDAGCGSGILAILAMKFGAISVFAFDYDLWSVENTIENLLLNNIQNGVEVVQGKIENIELPPADGIAANMFTNLLVASMHKFYISLKDSNGDLILSGILKYDEEIIINSAIENGFKLVRELSEDEWVGLQFKIEK